jgi:hypothetical protein
LIYGVPKDVNYAWIKTMKCWPVHNAEMSSNFLRSIKMKRYMVKALAVMAAVMFLSITVMELNAHARAGGSRSSGSRGSRSYSRPVSPPSQMGQQYAPAPRPLQQQAGGGFMRSMAGGMMGGMLGSMLFSSFAGASGGMGAGTGGGIGLFEIILLAGGGYLIYRYMKKKKAALAPAAHRR